MPSLVGSEMCIRDRWYCSRGDEAHTGCESVDECSNGGAVVPVAREVGDVLLGDLAADPLEQALFGRLVLARCRVLVLPHRHRDGVVQDQRPDQAHYQLQLLINDVRTVCSTDTHQSWNWVTVRDPETQLTR